MVVILKYIQCVYMYKLFKNNKLWKYKKITKENG